MVAVTFSIVFCLTNVFICEYLVTRGLYLLFMVFKLCYLFLPSGIFNSNQEVLSYITSFRCVYREIKDMILVIMHNSDNRMSHVSHLASYRTV